jgi:hypothetical protein
MSHYILVSDSAHRKYIDFELCIVSSYHLHISDKSTLTMKYIICIGHYIHDLFHGKVYDLSTSATADCNIAIVMVQLNCYTVKKMSRLIYLIFS